MRMKMNGRNSCKENSRHIDIMYFFIKDRAEKGELSIMYCAMNIILADYFTNPLQGAMVRASTYKLLGYIGSYSIKERVRKQIPIKYIPSKKVVPLKNTDMFEDKV